MNTEELMKAFAQGGITVQGDLVMEKRVEYEVSNVEAGGIGIQVVNGKEDLSGKEDLDGGKEKYSPGPRRKYLFIEGDASWERQGKRRDPSKENTVVRRRERDRLLEYLRLHKMAGRPLTTQQGDTLNSIVASFLTVWREKGWIGKDFSGIAVYRFLHDECGIKSDIDPQTYANKITPWVKNKKYSIEILAEVEEYIKTITEE